MGRQEALRVLTTSHAQGDSKDFFFFNLKTSEVSLRSPRGRKARVVFRERSNLRR